MGGCGSSPAVVASKEQDLLHVSQALDMQVQSDQERMQSVNKLLLLGSGESGKSTLFKQMNEIYGQGLDEAQRTTYKSAIHSNVLESMVQLIKACKQKPVQCQASRDHVMTFDPEHQMIDAGIAEHLEKLWQDPAIQEAYTNRHQFYLPDSAAYYFERLKELGQDAYVPSTQDVLRVRIRTAGIVEKEFVISGLNFKLLDVGGQRCERRKWVHCFEHVTAVLFVGVLSEYYVTLFEDDKVNRMEDTLNLFEEVVNSRWFGDVNFILFLNKKDLFEQKIKMFPLTSCKLFANHDPSINCYEGGIAAITKLFTDRVVNKNKTLYPHVTCATDTNQTAIILDSVKDTIIKKLLDQAGLM